MKAVRLIMVDDSQDDADLLLMALREAGFAPDWRRVEREEDYISALETSPDLVLCDYGLPRFSACRALELRKARAPDVPFIIVSGYIGEDVAVAMLKAGANDYLLKDSLARLGPAVERELREAQGRRRQRRLEEALRTVAEAVIGPTGQAFLESLVLQLAKITHADYVFIGEFIKSEASTIAAMPSAAERNSVRTVVACAEGKIVENLQYPLDDRAAEEIIAGQVFSRNEGLQAELPLLSRLGFKSYMGTALVDSAGHSMGLMAIMHNAPITDVQIAEALLKIYAARAAGELERMAQTAALEFQASHDPLTQLSNRYALQSRMEEIFKVGGAQAKGALLLLDLDRFKEVNDTLGHQSGDAILKQIGPRLRRLLSGEHFLCRLGGDEFALLIVGNADKEAVEQLAKSLLQAIREPFKVDGINLRIDASIGIALYPEHGDNTYEILRRADVAMYLAKREGSGYRIYHPGHDIHSPARLMLMTDLRHALETNQLVLHYQPKRILHGPDELALEALVRWQHPQRGLLPPEEFVPFAEMTDLIRPLTLWVVDAAVRQYRRWRDAGYTVKISVNISTRNLLDQQLPDLIAAMVKKHDVPPECLEFEITESAIMADPGRSLGVLRRISAMGHQLSIDDFGTGYSSLAYLTKLPVQNLKIDRAFVRQMIRSPRDASIVQSTIGLAHNLGMRVIAEGVEDAATLEKLRGLKCDEAQGYLISRPVSATDIAPMLQTEGAWRIRKGS
ncbi:MAG: EAL domain-containing protein [Burkholderiales bacterium]|nr:EAL domain-containing protein [Burkholderiales bacterium]